MAQQVPERRKPTVSEGILWIMPALISEKVVTLEDDADYAPRLSVRPKGRFRMPTDREIWLNRELMAAREQVRALVEALEAEYPTPWHGVYPTSPEWWAKVEAAIASAKESATQPMPELQQLVSEAVDHERHASHDTRDQQRPDGVSHRSPEPLD